MSDDYTLYDVLNGNIPEPTAEGGVHAVMWRGLNIIHTGNDAFDVHYDGHLGSLHKFTSDEYDDVLELVDDLVTLVIEYNSLWQKDRYEDTNELIEWAGKIMMFDEETANENPDRYVHVPAYDEVVVDE